MAVIPLVDAVVTINAVDESANVTAVELDLEGVDLVTTNFGSAGWDERIGGMKSGTVRVSFNSDYASAALDSKLFTLFNTVTTFNVRADDAAVSASNPEYQFSVLCNELSPIAGSVGDLATQDVTWPITGTVTRAVA